MLAELFIVRLEAILRTSSMQTADRLSRFVPVQLPADTKRSDQRSMPLNRCSNIAV
jgi:hypothetical protein